MNGIIDEFLYDVTDEIFDFEHKKWFTRNIGKRFDIEVKCEDKDITDVVAKLYNLPVQLLFIEQFDSTLEDLLKNDIDMNLLECCLFQTIFGLAYLQKHFNYYIYIIYDCLYFYFSIIIIFYLWILYLTKCS